MVTYSAREQFSKIVDVNLCSIYVPNNKVYPIDHVQRPKTLESSAIPIDQLILYSCPDTSVLGHSGRREYINNLNKGSLLNRNPLQPHNSHYTNLFAHGLFV
jgi:hypothetical protein